MISSQLPTLGFGDEALVTVGLALAWQEQAGHGGNAGAFGYQPAVADSILALVHAKRDGSSAPRYGGGQL